LPQQVLPIGASGLVTALNTAQPTQINGFGSVMGELGAEAPNSISVAARTRFAILHFYRTLCDHAFHCTGEVIKRHFGDACDK
jgi:hypothetical protein